MDRIERVSVFPGSFNPFTLGHLSIVERAVEMFDKVVVAVGYNEHKSNPEDLQPILTQIKKAVRRFGEKVEVVSYTGLTVDFCKSIGSRIIVRGIRSVADFEYERNMADVNRKISGIETVFLPSLPELSAFSSSVVRELNRFGYDTSDFLPKED